MRPQSNIYKESLELQEPGNSSLTSNRRSEEWDSENNLASYKESILSTTKQIARSRSADNMNVCRASELTFKETEEPRTTTRSLNYLEDLEASLFNSITSTLSESPPSQHSSTSRGTSEESSEELINEDENSRPVQTSTHSYGRKIFAAFTIAISIWGFLLTLKIFGTGLNLLGGKDSAKMFDVVSNPLSGVMLGIFATLLVQSSSTSTTMIVSAVGAGELSIKNAIAMVMGANIGTTATNTLVSLFNINNRENYKRAFAAATVHDLFNILTVLMILPLQWASNFLGLITGEMVKNYSPCERNCTTWKNPLSFFVDPVVSAIAVPNKKVIYAITKGECADNNNTLCDEPLLQGGVLYRAQLSDQAAGAVCSIASIPLLYFSLFCIVKGMHFLLQGRLVETLQKVLKYNPYVTILIGALITMIMQSSSVVTSAIVPLCGSGLISLEEMFPLTLGANVGTCATGLIAAVMASGYGKEALQTALSHLFFNIIGVAINYPIRPIRNKILNTARWLGDKARQHCWFPIAYTAVAFVGVPLISFFVTEAVAKAISPQPDNYTEPDDYLAGSNTTSEYKLTM